MAVRALFLPLDRSAFAVTLREPMKFLRGILAAMVVLSGVRARADLVDGVSAIVHDSIITLQEVEDATMDVARELQPKYRGQPAEFQKRLYEAQKDNLDQLVERQLILH